ncbi:MAG: hypothetical protein KDI56_03570, partial [Xanthomonadales bacterium]|nr:hypothetical protein [Xanthomonadales bacterium]
MMSVTIQPYPTTHRQDLVETLHGTPIPDPYRWLEELDSQETRRWIDAQNVVTNAYLAQVEDRPAIQAQLARLWN